MRNDYKQMRKVLKYILKIILKYDIITLIENHSQNQGGIMPTEVISYYLKMKTGL